MTTNAGLAHFKPIAFIPIREPQHAKHFYRDVLGLELISEESPFALVFNVGGIMLRLAIVADAKPSPGTVFGWQAPDIEAAVQGLMRAGVAFERYEFMQQNELGIWDSPSGARVAWFKDPDGNVLSISHHPEYSDFPAKSPSSN